MPKGAGFSFFKEKKMERVISLYHSNAFYRAIMTAFLAIATGYVGVQIGMAYGAKFANL